MIDIQGPGRGETPQGENFPMEQGAPLGNAVPDFDSIPLGSRTPPEKKAPRRNNGSLLSQISQEKRPVPERLSPQDFAQRLKLSIKDMLLFSRALTHRSYLNEHPEALEDNERLEFLGDAVLDFLVGAWLYNHFPEMAEGELTRLRSALVRTEQLAEFARQIDLGSAIRLGKGEEDNGGRSRTSLLCAGFEALIGALYLDGGLDPVYGFMESMLADAVGPILENHRERDPKSTLQELVQSQGLGQPDYRTVDASGPDHAKIFEVEVWVKGILYGRGLGHSKQAAAKAAARAALKALGKD